MRLRMREGRNFYLLKQRQLAIGLLFVSGTIFADDSVPVMTNELDVINVPAARKLGLNGKGVAIGVLDGGFLVNHPSFSGANIRYVTYDATISGVPYVFDPTVLLTDKDSAGNVKYSTHGANVSGIMVGSADDAQGYKGGVAPAAQLYVSSYMPSSEPAGQEDVDSIFAPDMQMALGKGLQALYENVPDLRVINNSWNDFNRGNTAAEIDAIQKHANEQSNGVTVLADSLTEAVKRDVLLVFAAGNEGYRQPELMAVMPRYMPELEKNYLSVVALDATGNMADYSHWCGVSKNWCLAAPGDMVVATTLNAPGEGPVKFGLEENSGTSFAAPLVSSSAALLKQRFPYMTMAQVRAVMLTTATQMGEARVDEQYGWGMLNVGSAVNGPAQLFGNQTYTLDAASTGWAANDIWRNSITAGGILTKAGSGSLTLNGAQNTIAGVNVSGGRLTLGQGNTFSEASAVAMGELQVNGSLTGPSLDIGPQGALAGSGRIAAPTRLSGTLRAGGAAGALTFNQALVMDAGSHTQVVMDASENSPSIRLSGAQAKATLGGTLRPDSAAEGVGASQLVLASDRGGSYEGRFEALEQSAVLRAQDLRYDLFFRPDSIRLGVHSNTLPGQAGLNANARSGAALLNALRDSPLALGESRYNQWLEGSLSSANMGGMASRVGGQIHADSLAYALRQPQQLQRAFQDQLSSANAVSGSTHFWVSGLNDNLTHAGRSGVSASKENTAGVQAGVMYTLNTQTAIAGGFSQSKGKISGENASADLNISQFNISGRYGLTSLAHGAYVGGQLSAGYLDYASTRNLQQLGQAKGDSKGSLYSARMYSGYRWQFDNWFVDPRIGLQTAGATLRGFRENGSELALDVKRRSQSNTSGLLEIGVGRSVKFADWQLSSGFSLGYERVFSGATQWSSGDVHGITVRQQSAQSGKNLYTAGVKLDAQYRKLNLSLRVDGVKGGGSSGGGVNLQVNHPF